jgi:hypothetical protein
LNPISSSLWGALWYVNGNVVGATDGYSRDTALEAKRIELKKTGLSFITLAELKEEASQTLSYGLKA